MFTSFTSRSRQEEVIIVRVDDPQGWPRYSTKPSDFSEGLIALQLPPAIVEGQEWEERIN